MLYLLKIVLELDFCLQYNLHERGQSLIEVWPQTSQIRSSISYVLPAKSHPLLKDFQGFVFILQGCREVISKLFSYILTRHPKAIRKMVMNGILNSFSKTGAKPQSESGDQRISSSSSLRKRASTHHSIRNAKRESKNKGRLRSRTNMVLEAFSPTLSNSGSIKKAKKVTFRYTVKDL